MPMPAILGTIAQEGQAVAGGSGDPTVATSEVGNYDSALLARLKNGTQNLDDGMVLVSGSEFSSGACDIVDGFHQDWLSANFSGANNVQIRVGAYLREGGETAQHFTWSLHSLTHNIGNPSDYGLPPSALVTSSMSTSQDSTSLSGSNHGVTGYVVINAGGGRGGLTFGRGGDYIQFKLKGSVDGTTTEDVTCKIRWDA